MSPLLSGLCLCQVCRGGVWGDQYTSQLRVVMGSVLTLRPVSRQKPWVRWDSGSPAVFDVQVSVSGSLMGKSKSTLKPLHHHTHFSHSLPPHCLWLPRPWLVGGETHDPKGCSACEMPQEEQVALKVLHQTKTKKPGAKGETSFQNGSVSCLTRQS